jgi:hypothetical protein
MYKTFLIN